ncbi:MAG: OsmC family protein [Proteobacteria bacterium]|nr:OsmC family protein [Pseudomonadota bacterium]
MPKYTNKVVWKGKREGYTYCENGTEMDFSAPPALYGFPDRMTPEDAYMMAVNTCVHMMVIWAVERFRFDMVSFECTAEGEVEEHLDKTSWFKKVMLKPRITVRNAKEAAVLRALEMARKYSTIAESIKSEIVIEPEIIILK